MFSLKIKSRYPVQGAGHFLVRHDVLRHVTRVCQTACQSAQQYPGEIQPSVK